MGSMRALDVVMALWLALEPERERETYSAMGEALYISPSQANDAVRRLIQSRMVSESKRVDVHSLLKFLEHGVRFVFPATIGSVAIGIPTAHSASPLKEMIRHDEEVVWPHSSGEVRGQAIEPLHRSVPPVALEDRSFHEALSLVDALRVGRARERIIAFEELQKRLSL